MAKEKPVLDEKRLAVIAASSLTNIKENRAALEALRDKYTGIEVDGITDKENLKIIKAGVSELRTARTDIEKVRQSEKAYILRAGEMLDEAAETLTKIVAPIEEHCKNEVQRIKDLQDAEDRRVAEEKENRKQQRIAQLFENGLTFKDNRYTIGDINITPIEVTEYSESQFEGFIAMAQVEYEAIQLAEAEKEQERQRENERLRREQQEAAQREEQEREQRQEQQRRNEELLNERFENRISHLESIGFVDNEESTALIGRYGYKLFHDAIYDATKDEWDAELTEYKLHVQDGEKEERRTAEEEATKRTVAKGYISGNTSPDWETKPQPGKPDAIADPRVLQLGGMGFHYINEEDAFTHLGMTVTMGEVREYTPEVWEVLIKKLNDHLCSTPVQAILDGVLAEQAENQAAYFETRPYHCTLVFNTVQPFMDTKVGRSVLRLYVEEFLEEANEGLDSASIVESGNIEGSADLLFLVFRT